MLDAISAVILAGGQSRRMGMDKSFLPVKGSPLIEHIALQLCPLFPEVIIAADTPDRFRFLDLPIVCDAQPGQGPMGGMLAALSQSHSPWVLCIPCDTPFIPLNALASLAQHACASVQAVVPKNGDHLEPLFALYRRDTIPIMEELLQAGRRSVLRLIDRIETRIVPMDLELPNLNTLDDYHNYLATDERQTGETVLPVKTQPSYASVYHPKP
jgi:molybdenum cofactor guanylyltransferase